MSIKSRKKELQKVINKSAQKEFDTLIKKATEQSDQQAADSTDFSEKLFNDLLNSIKIEGLED